jgi:hypothetical protein
MRVLACFLLLAGAAMPAWAQDTAPAKPAPTETPAIDATKLGVSLSRIQKGLRTAETRQKTNPEGLRLEFNVQVFGIAPRIDVIPDGEDLVFGPVPGTAPSHSQFLEFVTPQIYRTQTMPISAFAALAARWMADKSKKSRCEEEIANYRALVMQGVNVSAPRCSQ